MCSANIHPCPSMKAQKTEYLLLAILHNLQLGFARQKVEDFASVDLEVAARNHQVLVRMLGRAQQLEDVSRGQRVDAVAAVLVLALELAPHGVRLP